MYSSVIFVGVVSLIGSAACADPIALIAKINDADNRRDATVTKFVSIRRYVLHNERWEADPVMEVRVTVEPKRPKQIEIVRMENADGMPKRVFQRLVEAEIEASKKKTSDDENALTAENYDFTHLGTEDLHGRNCTVLQLKPKKSSKYLIEGKAWVDPVENAVIRVEGRTAKNVSFWIGKPWITQDFRKVGDMWVPLTNRSQSNVRLLGKTNLTIDFLNYEFNYHHELAKRY